MRAQPDCQKLPQNHNRRRFQDQFEDGEDRTNRQTNAFHPSAVLCCTEAGHQHAWSLWFASCKGCRLLLHRTLGPWSPVGVVHSALFLCLNRRSTKTLPLD